MSLSRRKCIKADEDLNVTSVVLEAFANYSQSSCLLECRARKLQSECGCLPYYFPDFSRVWRQNTTCNSTGLECLANITSNLLCKFDRMLE